MKAAHIASILVLLTVVTVPAAQSPVTLGDYDHATGLRQKYESLALNVPEPATWIGKSDRFWFRKSVTGGHQFVIVDAQTNARQPAFDHERLAAGLSAAGAGDYTGVTLPF